MNKSILITGLIALLVGIGIGYMPRSTENSTSDKNVSHSIPSPMDQAMTNMIENLKGKKGEALDVAFLEGMILHHEGAIAMAKQVQSGTKRPEIQKMADDIIKAQTNEVTLMKEWLNQWFGR